MHIKCCILVCTLCNITDVMDDLYRAITGKLETLSQWLMLKVVSTMLSWEASLKTNIVRKVPSLHGWYQVLSVITHTMVLIHLSTLQVSLLLFFFKDCLVHIVWFCGCRVYIGVVQACWRLLHYGTFLLFGTKQFLLCSITIVTFRITRQISGNVWKSPFTLNRCICEIWRSVTVYYDTCSLKCMGKINIQY